MADRALNDVVLIVDDATGIVETLSVLLEADGFPTVTALDGAAGLDLARMHRPRVAIVDANMPVLDGRGLCTALRSAPGLDGIYLIFVTGEHEAAIRNLAIAAGADIYMQKPIDEDVLLAVIGDVFAGKRLARGAAAGARVVVRADRGRHGR